MIHTLPNLLARSVVLAEQGRFVDMGRRFRQGGATLDAQSVAFVLLVCALVALAVWGLARYFAFRERQGYNSDRGLFRELCRAHELNSSSCRLLWQLARFQRLARPADLFIDPRRFETQQLPGPLAKRKDDIARLRDRVFAGEARSEGR